MFTGIIHHQGFVQEIVPQKNDPDAGIALLIACEGVTQDLLPGKQAKPADRLAVRAGDSVAVSGVCLTVADIAAYDSAMRFVVMPETLRKTTLGDRQPQDRVNIETSLRVGDELGGHFVYGHVDAVGEIIAWEFDGTSVLMTVKIPQPLMRYMTPRGSIAIDGVSLTIAHVRSDAVEISLVAYTLEHTTFGQANVGTRVNIECDALAKMVLHRAALPEE